MSERDKGEPMVRYERRLKRTETIRVYDQDGIIVLKPLSPESCALYGRNTQWCISMSQTHRNWSNYSAKNVCFYIVINHNLDVNDPLHKTLAEVIDTGEIIWWDAKDNKIDKPKFIE